ncbi:hypothetical protein I6N90_16145 [Paenibacillus sp. GSMTC-2017]|nr:hypothetical protein [Paenibacillus sp. GSMTC-2017]
MIKLIRLISILVVSISLITACTNNSTDNSPKESNNNPSPAESLITTPKMTPSPTPATASPSPESPSPIPSATVQLTNIEEYDGTEVKKITIQGKEESSQWMRSTYSDLGFYMPPQMKQVKIYEGITYKLQSGTSEFLILTEDHLALPEKPIWDEELVQYKEYAGSKDEGGRWSDYFKVEYKESAYTVMLSFRDDELKEARPIFLDVMKGIKYEPLK